ncbi:ABC transporter permease [Ornithinimicrobium cavernae]|uniref:ABC transporter permease n=1 Tax=Ornithinimicrobium cavernae TaxID=2666047 RepID=UPI000D69168B|nr:ABC transporter permease [Ornithinimicrobium cavernae]
MSVAVLAPLAMSLWRSLTDPSLGLTHYTDLFTDGITLTIVSRTLMTSLIVTVGTVVLGYPYAYLMTRVSTTTRILMLTAVLVPFWTSMTARNFAWLILVQRDGPVDKMFSAVGIDGVVLHGTVAGVAVAMIQVMLPFMVLPLYSHMAGIDRKLLLAAQALGSTPIRAFRKIFLPLSVGGVVSGSILVFALSFGFYVTPAILGSPQQSLVAQLLGQRTLQLLDFAAAGALGIVVLLFTLALVTVANRMGGSVSALGASVAKGK